MSNEPFIAANRVEIKMGDDGWLTFGLDGVQVGSLSTEAGVAAIEWMGSEDGKALRGYMSFVDSIREWAVESYDPHAHEGADTSDLVEMVDMFELAITSTEEATVDEGIELSRAAADFRIKGGFFALTPEQRLHWVHTRMMALNEMREKYS